MSDSAPDKVWFVLCVDGSMIYTAGYNQANQMVEDRTPAGAIKVIEYTRLNNFD